MNQILSLQNVVYSFQDLPLRLWNLLLRASGLKKVFSDDNVSSDSDSTDYSRIVDRAVTSEESFKKFRKNFYYRQILEHVDYKLGREYLDRLSTQSKAELLKYSEISALSNIGSPRRYFFGELGFISPTIIRYQYVSQELQRHFGESIGTNLVEIGVGFGGQFAVLQKSFNFENYTMFDLPQVLTLTHKVLNSAGVRTSQIVDGRIDSPIVEKCDFVMSNYAFSELPKVIQKGYIEGVLRNARRGYLIMNSGKTDISGRSSGKYSLAELQSVLPPFEVLPEAPLTGPDNYVIIWGHLS